MSVAIPHHASYGGEQDATATRTEAGGLQIDGIGYYEETIILTAEHLRQLGLRDVDDARITQLKVALDQLREHRKKWSVDPGDSFEVERAAAILVDPDAP